MEWQPHPLGRVLDSFVLAQLRGEIIGVKFEAARVVTAFDARHLAWLRDQTGDRFRAGVVLHAGPCSFRLGERASALPIGALWQRLLPAADA
ncbi:MAG: hypothetical protein M0T77_14325 [Actinomycetota bacterium]|nr:hypothetical protein [Actinomycetota bacterium]